MRVLRVAHHAVVSAWRARERELVGRGVDLTLVSARRWNEGGRDVDLASAGDDFVRGAATVGRHPNVFLYSPRRLWRLLGEEWDLIDLHEEPCSLAVAQILVMRRLRGSHAPYVLYSAQNIAKRYPPPFRWFERWALRGAAGAYVCNDEAGRILVRKGLRGPVRTIGLGVDLDAFEPAERPPPSTDALVVGYAGRLEAHKGVLTLLRAASLRPGWTVRIAGDGPYRAALEVAVEGLGLGERVTFVGALDVDELASHYHGCDVLVVPSLTTPTWVEQFGRVAVESMACGTPVVASASGALPDVVGQAGTLFEAGDTGALVEAVETTVEPSTWASLRSAGREVAAQYAWPRVAAAQLALYRGCVDVSVGERRDRPDVQVVVVAYGDPALLDGALEALGGELDVVVVDNSSSARTAAVAERHGAEYVDPGRNLGFAAGVNVGVRRLRERNPSSDLLLLNPDARVDPAGVRRMHELAYRGRVAAVGATQTDPGSGAAARVLWPFPSPTGAWLEAVGFGRLRQRGDFAIGSVLLVRADAWAEVGEMDERYFLYSEETDWQRRARTSGWDVAVADAGATHVGAGTGGDPARREVWFHASLESYVRKHHGRAGWASFRAAMIVGAAVRVVLLPGERGRAARRRRDLYLLGPSVAERAAR